jgi:hypothetical protein
MMNGTFRLTIVGRNLCPAVVGGVPAPRDPDVFGPDGGLGGTINGDYWIPDLAVYPGIHDTGRHGVATSFTVTDLLIWDVSSWRTGSAIVDVEPASPTAVITRPQIRNTETGLHTLLWLAAACPRAIMDLVAADNTCYEHITIDTRHSGATHRHSTAQPRRPQGQGRHTFEVDRIDGLEIRDNFQRVKEPGLGIDAGCSIGVVIAPAENVQFPQ